MLQEITRELPMIYNALQFIRDLSNLIRDSPKRKTIFKSMFGEGEVVLCLLSICDTRWTVRSSAIKRVLDVYGKVIDTLKELSTSAGEIRSKSLGLMKKATSMKMFFFQFSYVR